MQDERRRFTRIQFDTQALLSIDAVDLPVSLLDISLKGALVTTAQATAPDTGKAATLYIPLGNQKDAARIKMQVSIVYHHKTEGVQEQSPLTSMGLRCTEIDLDSITHLTRLVELNLGDPALLMREFESLLPS